MSGLSFNGMEVVGTLDRADTLRFGSNYNYLNGSIFADSLDGKSIINNLITNKSRDSPLNSKLTKRRFSTVLLKNPDSKPSSYKQIKFPAAATSHSIETPLVTSQPSICQHLTKNMPKIRYSSTNSRGSSISPHDIRQKWVKTGDMYRKVKLCQAYSLTRREKIEQRNLLSNMK
jgi:hypothetical protein